MLPAAVPNARIMRYGYDSAWYGPQRTNTFPRTISQDLLQHLHRERKVRRFDILWLGAFWFTLFLF